MNLSLSKEEAVALLDTLVSSGHRYVYEPDKHRLVLHDDGGNTQAHFRLPLVLRPPGTSMDAGAPVTYVILLIQAGSCALGYFEDSENLDHKVFRAYMVRKKQGTSQLKYLKTKGKSRAGSRVRLGETAAFFEQINERLQTYFAENTINRIAISCSKTLIPYLFNAKTKTPFTKHDPRLFKIPKHIHTPIYEVLLDANKFLQRGELIVDAAQLPALKHLLGNDRVTARLHHTRPDDTPYLEEEAW